MRSTVSPVCCQESQNTVNDRTWHLSAAHRCCGEEHRDPVPITCACKSQMSDLCSEVHGEVWPGLPSLASASSSLPPQGGDAAYRPSCLEDPKGKSTSPPHTHTEQLPCLRLYRVVRFQTSPSPAAPAAILIPEPVPWTPGGPWAAGGPRLCGGQSSGGRAALVRAPAVWAAPTPDCGGDQCRSGSLHFICDAFEH